MPVLLTGTNLGVIASLVIIAIGLIWLFYRTITGREVERRVIFLFMAIAVGGPVLFPIIFKEHPSQIVKDVFEKIESLPAGSHVLVSFDFDPAGAPELQPQANAIIRHLMVKNHRVIFMGLWNTGQSLLTQSVNSVVRREFPEKVEGTDYAVLGYKAGNEGVLNVIVTDLHKMFPTDVNTRPLTGLPIFTGIRSCRNMDLIVALGSGQPGAKEWVLFVGDPANVPVAAGVSAVSAPQLYAYYPKQLLGLLGGVKGGAEYEQELRDRYPQFENTPKPALTMMGPQTLAHLVIMAFIIMGNIAYFRKKRMGGGA